MSAGMEDRRELDEFVKLAINGAKALMRMAHGIEVDIQLKQVLKNNGQKYDGLMFKADGQQAAPTIYVNDAFDRYMDGESMDSIVRGITEAAYHGMQKKMEMPELTKESFKQHIRLTVVNADANEALLQDTPHYKICDDTLAVYPRYYISDEASFRVTNAICMSEQLMMTSDEVLAAAKINTENLEYKVASMSEMLHGILADTGQLEVELDFMMEQAKPEMVVITTMDGVNGASCLVAESALEEAREMLGYDSMIIIPSSIHEVIAVPDNGSIEPDAIAEMIREVNLQLQPTEVLCQEPMRWSPERKLTLAIESPQLDVVQSIERKVDRTMSMA